VQLVKKMATVRVGRYAKKKHVPWKSVPRRRVVLSVQNAKIGVASRHLAKMARSVRMARSAKRGSVNPVKTTKFVARDTSAKKSDVSSVVATIHNAEPTRSAKRKIVIPPLALSKSPVLKKGKSAQKVVASTARMMRVAK